MKKQVANTIAFFTLEHLFYIPQPFGYNYNVQPFATNARESLYYEGKDWVTEIKTSTGTQLDFLYYFNKWYGALPKELTPLGSPVPPDRRICQMIWTKYFFHI
jgi:hypothetical protein